MRTRYLTGLATAKRETDLAFLCSFNWHDDHGYAVSNVWIPKSVLDESCHDDISDACAGDLIEIHIAEWWLLDNC